MSGTYDANTDTYRELWGTSSPVTGSAPTSATDGQPLDGLGAITVTVSSDLGTTLSGAGTLAAYLYDTGVLPPSGGDGISDAATVKNFLRYDGQTGNFTVGQVVTGTTSGAVGTIAADADGGTEGCLTLTAVTGTFQDNEAITDPITGAATVNTPNFTGNLTKLNYVTQTANYHVGLKITGGTSAATAVILADADAGATGTLTLALIAGTFVTAEIVTDSSAGSATASGSQYFQITYANGVGLQVGQLVTGQTSGATGVISVDSGTVLTLTAPTGTFANSEVMLASAVPRWVRLPSADFSIVATGLSSVIDIAFDPVVVETPRKGRIKWVPVGVTFGAGSLGVTTHQLGQGNIEAHNAGEWGT